MLHLRACQTVRSVFTTLCDETQFKSAKKKQMVRGMFYVHYIFE